jgi:hypothetical protein
VVQGQPDNLDVYKSLGAEEVARLVLCLLIEECIQRRLTTYRKSISEQPVGARLTATSPESTRSFRSPG